MLQMTCADAGFACDVVFKATNEEELLKEVRVHAMAVHSFDAENFTPELNRKIKSLITRK